MDGYEKGRYDGRYEKEHLMELFTTETFGPYLTMWKSGDGRTNLEAHTTEVRIEIMAEDDLAIPSHFKREKIEAFLAEALDQKILVSHNDPYADDLMKLTRVGMNNLRPLPIVEERLIGLSVLTDLADHLGVDPSDLGQVTFLTDGKEFTYVY
jgi:hypothetical protein